LPESRRKPHFLVCNGIGWDGAERGFETAPFDRSGTLTTGNPGSAKIGRDGIRAYAAEMRKPRLARISHTG
jgi:hypothetical protein